MWNRFKTLDPWLFALPLMLMVMSVVVIYALTVDSSGAALYGRQAVYAGISYILLIFIAFIDYRSLKAWSNWIYAIGIIGLIAVPIFGTAEFGAKLWINLGPFQFQPGELLKVVVMIILASLLSRGHSLISNRRFLVSVVAAILPILIILVEPDLGTALVILAISVGMWMHASLTKLQKGVIIAGLLVGVLVFGLSLKGVRPFSGVLKDYQKDRLTSFIHPSRDKQGGSGYNVVQSVIAVGSGGLSGQGLGFGSTQSQLNFLPVAHADFIFAVIAEAWGLVGAWGVLALYVFLIIRIIQAARIAKDQFGMLLCIGVAVKIIFEVLVNVGMNIQLMPVTGIPLPMLSYGGTAMITNAIAIGMVQSVVMRFKRLTF